MTEHEIVERVFKLNNKYRKEGSMGPFYRGWIKRSLSEGRTLSRCDDSNFGFVSFRILKKKPFINLQKLACEKTGTGLGTQLMNELFSIAREKNLSVLTRVSKTNPAAMEFYKKHGFVVVGDEGKKHTILMEKTDGKY